MVVGLERGADLHMAQLMPLPLTVCCFSKIQIGFTFLVLAYPGSPGQRAVKCVCACACMRACVCSCVRACARVCVPISKMISLASCLVICVQRFFLCLETWARQIKNKYHIMGYAWLMAL